MVDYLDHCYEYYASGQFFQTYNTDGQEVFEKAKVGDGQARQWYAEMGTHLGQCNQDDHVHLRRIAYYFRKSSVRFAYPYFQETMWQRINTFAFRKSIEKLQIEDI